MNSTTQVCRTCKKELPIDMFGVANRNPNGRNYHCLECAQEKRYENKEKRLAAMTIDELKALEVRNNQKTKEARARNPEKRRAQGKRYRMLNGIPKWNSEHARLVELLSTYEMIARPFFEENGIWRISLDEHDVGDFAAVWNDLAVSMRWLGNKLNSLHLPANPHDVIVYRIAWLQSKLDEASEGDKEFAFKRAQRGPSGQRAFAPSLRREMEAWEAESVVERAEAEAVRAAWPAEERAHDRARKESIQWGFDQNNHEDPDDDRRSVLLSNKSEARMAEWRSGGCSWAKVQSAEDDVAEEEWVHQQECERLATYQYGKIYPKYLAEEQEIDKETAKAVDAAAEEEPDAATEDAPDDGAERNSLLGPVEL